MRKFFEIGMVWKKLASQEGSERKGRRTRLTELPHAIYTYTRQNRDRHAVVFRAATTVHAVTKESMTNHIVLYYRGNSAVTAAAGEPSLEPETQDTS